MSFSKLTLMCFESSNFFAQDIMEINMIQKKRQQFGDYREKYNKLKQNPEDFFDYTGVSMETFDYILRKTESALGPSGGGVHVDATFKILLTMRYLSAGESIRSIAETFNVGRSTVSKWIYQTMKAMLQTLERHITPPTTVQFKDISRLFYHKHEFPNCVGVVGRKLIRVRKSRLYGTKCYKHRKSFFVTLQAVADVNSKFLTFEINEQGETFQETKLCKSLESDNYNVPKSRYLPNTDIAVPHVLIGGEDVPLKAYLMRPFPQKNIDVPKQVYNDKLLQTKQCVDVALQTLITKFRIFDKPIELNSKNCKLIITTACLLHNVVREKDGRRDLHYRTVTGKGIIKEKKSKVLNRRANNRYSNRATQIRNKFMEYFNK